MKVLAESMLLAATPATIAVEGMVDMAEIEKYGEGGGGEERLDS